MDILAGLNPAQREAVVAGGGPLLILAGPGSGKTRVIAHRIAYLVADEQVQPWRILAVTFTNKAARELRNRVAALLGTQAAALNLGTFHAICSRILRVDGAPLGIDRGFTIYDDDDQIKLMDRVFTDLSLDPRRLNRRAVLSAISRAKSELTTPEQLSGATEDYFQEVVARCYRTYQDRLVQNHALDFDDLLMRTVELFQVHEPVLEKYRQRFLHVLVDEFQDTNVAQYILTRLLASGHGNICVVGDPDQSIYAWRAADVRNILGFEQDFPGARVVLLEQNYRSTQTILDSAQGVIRANPQRRRRELWTENGAGELVTLLIGSDEQDEARLVVDAIGAAMRHEQRRAGDFAVMFRTNVQSRALEEALVQQKIPYRLVGGTRFYERREVKDLIAYLRLLNNPFDGLSLLRVINVPPRGIGVKTVNELVGWAQDQDLPLYQALQRLEAGERGDSAHTARPPFQARTAAALVRFVRLLNELIERAGGLSLSELLDVVLESIDYRTFLDEQYEDAAERWQNVQALRKAAEEYQQQEAGAEAGWEEGIPELLAGFLEGVSLVADVDELGEGTNSVTLITLHAAKGLEFPIVFITGLEQGLLPHSRSIDDPEQMEEERRLCYVGITRAKERLYLTRAKQRMLNGSTMSNGPSAFIRDVPAELTQARQRLAGDGMYAGIAGVGRSASLAASWREATATPPQRPTSRERFREGDRVRHAKFGEGTVVAMRDTGVDQEVTVAFSGEYGLKKLLVSFAKLERL